MIKRIFLLITLYATTINATNLYIVKDGAMVYNSSVEEVDSITFYAPQSLPKTEITIETKGSPILSPFYAIVSGQIIGTQTEKIVGFIYSTDSNLSAPTSRQVSKTSNGEFVMTLTGLLDDETYYYAAYGINDGLIYMGDIKSFHTPALTYSIDNEEYQMVRVENGASSFSIMQTELPINKSIQINGITFNKIDTNNDAIVTEYEFKTFLSKLRETTNILFRLPTGEEWKYAAAGGQSTHGYTYAGSNTIDNVGWYKGNSSGVAHALALKQANELGIYDMTGNYAELCNNINYNHSELYFDLSNTGLYDVDGPSYGGNYQDASTACTVTSYKAGIVAGKIAGTYHNEQYAVEAHATAIRLVYSR